MFNVLREPVLDCERETMFDDPRTAMFDYNAAGNKYKYEMYVLIVFPTGMLNHKRAAMLNDNSTRMLDNEPARVLDGQRAPVQDRLRYQVMMMVVMLMSVMSMMVVNDTWWRWKVQKLTKSYSSKFT